MLRITDAAGTRDVSVTKADYDLTPVSSRYGARIIDDGGRRVGYLNLRTFIYDRRPGAAQRLRHLPGAGRHRRHRRPSLQWRRPRLDRRADGRPARPQPLGQRGVQLHHLPAGEIVEQLHPLLPDRRRNSIAPTRIAFIGTTGTASASELVINAFIPYLHANAALVGTNTYGKPVGQIAVDRAACDDRLRVVAFKTENAARQGDYYDGLATKVEASCQAGDDLTRRSATRRKPRPGPRSTSSPAAPAPGSAPPAGSPPRR